MEQSKVFLCDIKNGALCRFSHKNSVWAKKKSQALTVKPSVGPLHPGSMTLHSFTQAGFLWKKYIKFFRFHICIVLCIFYLIVSLIPVHSFNRLKKKN